MTPSVYRNNGGFTLLELLVAMVLLAVVVGLVAASMRVGFRSVEAGDRIVLSQERIRSSVQVFESHLLSAMKVLPAKDAQAGELPVQFVGDSGSVAFKSYHSLWGGLKGPVSVVYRVADDGYGKKTLRLAESPLVIDAPRDVLLIDHADDITFDFFAKGLTDETGKWVDQWSESDRFPVKVRITVKKDRRLITLVVAVPVAEKEPKVVSVKKAGP